MTSLIDKILLRTAKPIMVMPHEYRWPIRYKGKIREIILTEKEFNETIEARESMSPEELTEYLNKLVPRKIIAGEVKGMSKKQIKEYEALLKANTATAT